ncbi:hypothetical protein QCD60_19925 [Pokkaliibacter sp. MBI-7]|uniref:hypothetical protein n=1 Tax=Pokkaliibacter sp. MBI-7 TaxID=3040600 RepID=UPI00244B5D2B|nr:hypothetical protein [Pokkaliibacter sp. MBI-7]MDH2434814.1 hypothetical protein [Pokkaliibacter sp. MBI-7]
MACYHLIHPRSHLSGQYGIDTPWQADQVRQLLAFIQRVRDTFPVLPGIDDGLSEATAMLVLEQVLPDCRALTCSLSCSAAAARRQPVVPVNLVQVWYEVAAVTPITTLYQLSMAMGVGLSDVSHALAQVLLRQAESVHHADWEQVMKLRWMAAGYPVQSAWHWHTVYSQPLSGHLLQRTLSDLQRLESGVVATLEPEQTGSAPIPKAQTDTSDPTALQLALFPTIHPSPLSLTHVEAHRGTRR